MLQYNYNSISIIVTNIVILEVLSARFVHPGSPQPTTLFFFLTRVMENVLLKFFLL